MTDFALTVQFSTVVAGAGLGTATSIETATLSRTLSRASTLSFVMADTLSPTVEAALRATGNVLANLRVGGTSAARMLLGKTSRDMQAPSPFAANGPTIEDGYDNCTLIHHENAYNVNMQGVVSRIMTYLPGLPEWLGVGDLYFTARLADAAQPLVVSYDIDTVSPIKALSLIARDIGAALDPNMGQWWADSVANVINIGRVGLQPALSFGGTPGPGVYPVQRHVTVEPDYTAMIHRLVVDGGSSNHGLPVGARCTGLALVPGVGGVSDAQFVGSFYATDEIGGVYYLTPDGNWHPLSQNIGVNALWYDTPRNILYAATPQGIKERPPTLNFGFFKQTGQFTGNCVDVFVDGVQVFAIATNNAQGHNGLFTYPSLSTNPVDLQNSIAMGWGYWTHITPDSDVISASSFNGTVYMVEQGNPTEITVFDNVVIDGGGYTTRAINIAPAGGYAITRLQRSVYNTGFGTFVLTSGGSDAVFYIDGTGNIAANLNAGGSLEPQMINRVLAVQGTIPAGAPRLIATTNDGPWVSTSGGGFGPSTHWEPMCDLFTDPLYQVLPGGGLTDKQVTHILPGKPKSAPDGISTPMLAAQDSTMYETANSGKYWRDQIQVKVSPGAALRAGHVATGPLAWQQTLDGNGFVVWYIQRMEPPFAPGGKFVYDSAPDISTTNNTTVDNASAILVAGTERYMLWSSTPSHKYKISSWTATPGDALCTLNLTDLVNVTLVQTACAPVAGISVTNEPCYVVEHTWTIDRKNPTRLQTQTTVSNTLVTQAYSLNDVISNMMYQQSRLARAS